MRCDSCGLQYGFRVANVQRMLFVLQNLRCPHCGKARTRDGDLPGRRCATCNMPEWLLPSFKAKGRPEFRLSVGLCAADYVALRRRMNKARAEEQDTGDEDAA